MEKILKTVKCDRCGGAGQSAKWQFTGMTCYKCNGTGLMEITERIYTEKEQIAREKSAKRRMGKKIAEQEAKRQEWEMEVKAREEKRIAEENERIANLHKGFIGNLSDKIEVAATYLYGASFEVKSFSGYGTTYMNIYAFETEDKKLVIWKSTSRKDFEKGTIYTFTGIVKEHTIYNEEEQTIIKNLKVA
jgi:DnaJ-class molecular chaperone